MSGSLVLFNLLLNGIGSFAVGALIAMAAARVVRRSPGRASVWLFTLPFAKLVFDVARGIPDDSFLWLRATGVRQDLGSFQLGFGVERFIPKVAFSLGALSGGVVHPQSAADLAASGLWLHLGAWAPGAVAGVLVAGAVVQLVRRVTMLARARADRRDVEAHRPTETRRAGFFDVAIHVVPNLEGSPFTAGMLKPFVALPERVWSVLSPEEREAALQHELGHIRELHLPLLTVTALVCDVFWFVPFIGRVHQRLVSACEVSADAIATRSGADPVALASALVRTREIAREGATPDGWVVGAAHGELGERVSRLLRPEAVATPTRFARSRVAARVAFVTWIGAAVAIASAFGNH